MTPEQIRDATIVARWLEKTQRVEMAKVIDDLLADNAALQAENLRLNDALSRYDISED